MHRREGGEANHLLVLFYHVLSGVGKNEVNLNSSGNGDVVEDGPVISLVLDNLKLGRR